MNLPSPQEKKAMRALYAAPKRPIIAWQVKQGSQVLYENASIALCYYFINTNGLNLKPVARYGK